MLTCRNREHGRRSVIISCGLLQCEFSEKFFPKRLGIFNQFFTHLLHDPFDTRLQMFTQISPTATKLCHTKRDHLANFYISLELQLLGLLTEQMTSLLKSCHIQHVCCHYKSVYFIATCHRQRSTKLSTTYANVWRSEHMRFGRWWIFSANYVNWIVALNMA